MLKQFFEWLVDMVMAILEWMIDLPEKVFLYLFEMLLNGCAFVYESIPVPSFVNQVSCLFAAIPPEIGYFVNAFRIPEGLLMLTGALLARFLLRRIPVIG